MTFYASTAQRCYLSCDRWDDFCLVCGGPSLNPNMVKKALFSLEGPPEDASIIAHLSLLSNLGNKLDWLDKCLGVPADNVPIQLGLYDCTGDFGLPDGALFGPYPSYAEDSYTEDSDAEAPKTDNQQYGLNCHAKCYQLLHDRLGYKLRYQDIWPKLKDAGDNEVYLQSTYGGITTYWDDHCTGPRFDYSSMNLNNAGWMLLDPTENEQNAQRILTVWRAVPEVQRPPLVLAVLCTFKKAAELAETKQAADDKHLWQAMAQVPSCVLRSILERAYFHPDFLNSAPMT